MKQTELWNFISRRLSVDIPVVLLCVLESQGSSPGRSGFKMAVAFDDIIGSIGGGIMEHKFVEMAKERLNSSTDPIIRRQVHNKVSKKDQSGMICSGEQTILLYYLSGKDFPVISSIHECLLGNKGGILEIAQDNISFSEKSIESESAFEMKSENDWKFTEKLGYKNHLHIVGGGHCSYALSELMSRMDFYVHVYEDRKNINTFLNNSFALEKKIVDDYSLLENIIPPGEDNYVVIMTFGYRTDDIALRALISKDFKYIGVLGSQTKMTRLFDEWKQDNLPVDKLENLFSPIGLRINSQTPEEIAVSIAAEIISVKNAVLKIENQK